MLNMLDRRFVRNQEYSVHRLWQTCLIACICLIVAGQPFAADFDTNVVIWSSKGNKASLFQDVPELEVTIDPGELIENNLTKVLAGRFLEVDAAPNLRDGLVVRLEYEKYNIPMGKERQVGWGTWENEITFSFMAAVFIDSKTIWERKIDLPETVIVSRNRTRENYRQAVVRAFDKAAAQVTAAMTSDPVLSAALKDVPAATNSTANPELQNLKPLLATYRVTESEGTIRRQPNAKGSTVRKLGMGSIVQIIGKLPTGWLQVAREGEAIGWIHESSVAVLNVQPAAQVAQAVVPPPSKVIPPRPAPVDAPAAAETFPSKPVAVTFPRGKPNPDDIAVIIGNANYKATAKDIPDVVPAYADAEGMKRYAVQALGIKEENVIFIKDAKLRDFVGTFGTDSNPRGKLWNWVKPGQSNVFVFYSGHGAPSSDGNGSYLVPTDAEAALIDLSGYSLTTLYANLGKLPAKGVTVVLEACFSGAAQNGMLVKNASPIYQKAMQEIAPENLSVISAGSGNQIASWEQDKSHGLFTKYFLLGMAGAADKKPYGNGDGKVATDELTAYLKGTMSYLAQRYYGREQTAQIIGH